MPFRLLAILALVLQPLLAGALFLCPCSSSSEPAAACRCDSMTCEAAEPCCAGSGGTESCCVETCCVDITGEADVLCECQSVCEAGWCGQAFFLTTCHFGEPLALPAQVRAVRSTGSKSPLDDLTWTTLPAHTHASLALPGWTWSNDRAPAPAPDASDGPASARLARLCVWTI